MKRNVWSIPFGRPEDISGLVEAGFNPLLAYALVLKGFDTPESAHQLLDASVSLEDPLLMKDMRKAAERIKRAIIAKETVAVYGDYDVDGITSSCLLYDYLIFKGLTCYCHIPDRDGEGYGLNSAALDAFKSKGVSLVITVDCGITAVDEAAHAKEIGIDLIITDHHECPDGDLPDALAVVDYKRQDDTYPGMDTAGFAGVGVAFKLVCACEGDSEAMLERYSDLVAIGTVADVMPLLGENRCMVRHGLKAINTHPRPGIAAMLNEAGAAGKPVSASSISFLLAPRLNAAGRLGKASMAAKLISSSDASVTGSLARELNEMNRERQRIENEIWNDAKQRLEGVVPDAPIVLADENWHQGVIGIAASRLAEQYCLPAIMICINGESGKGSCRSYGGFNLHRALNECSGLLQGFGGHALAAGLSISREKIDAFRQALREYYLKNMPESVPETVCDMLIYDPALLSIENVMSLDKLEPYGTGNSMPLMCMFGVRADSISSVGNNGEHMKMRVSLKGKQFDCIFFSHSADILGIREGAQVDIAFYPQINNFRNNTSVQLNLKAARPHDTTELCDSILSGDENALWTASDMTPDRKQAGAVWKSAIVPGSHLGSTQDELEVIKPGGLDSVTYALCLRFFAHAGLISTNNRCIYGAEIPRSFTKTMDFEQSEYIRLLRGYAYERR